MCGPYTLGNTTTHKGTLRDIVCRIGMEPLHCKFQVNISYIYQKKYREIDSE